MEHFIVSIFGMLLLPVLLVAVLAQMLGIRAEGILMALSSFLGLCLKAVLELLIILVRTIGGEAVVMIAKIFNVR